MVRMTKPQAAFLLKAMRHPGIEPYGSEWATLGALQTRDFAKRGGNQAYVTREGLKALSDYWMRKDAASGCVAYRATRDEVEATLKALHS